MEDSEKEDSSSSPSAVVVARKTLEAPSGSRVANRKIGAVGLPMYTAKGNG